MQDEPTMPPQTDEQKTDETTEETSPTEEQPQQ